MSRQKKTTGPRCLWLQNDHGVWVTKCGEMFEFIDGTPKDNGARFCQYCGGTLVARPAAES